jgi:GDP-L-fucose synthase
MTNKKILVLGSNGFIGRNIIEGLSAQDYNIFAPKRQELNLLETQSVENYIVTLKPDVVILSAVNIHSLSDNLVMYFNLERCSHAFGKMITIGSGAEYDMKNYIPMMTEDYFGKNIPSDIYGLSKYTISNNINSTPRNIVNLRVLGIYGKYEDYTRRFISNNICRALAGLEISINRNMKFDFLYVNDFLRILEIFINHDNKHVNYNTCTSTPIGLLDIAKIISKIHGTHEPVRVKQDGMNPEYSADNTCFMNEFGPFEFTELSIAVKELYEWYAHHPELDKICDQLREVE